MAAKKPFGVILHLENHKKKVFYSDVEDNNASAFVRMANWHAKNRPLSRFTLLERDERGRDHYATEEIYW